MIDAIGGRKVAVFGAVLVLSLALVLIKGDVPPGFISILQWVIPAFVLGNGIEHVANAYSSTQDAPGAPALAPAPVVSPDVVSTLQAALKETTDNDKMLGNALINVIQGLNANQALLTAIGEKAGIPRQ